MTRVVPIDSIVIEGRHRKDMGDIAGLAESIQAIGLLHPPVIRPDSRLVAGQRRIEAFRHLGRTEIPVNIAETLSDAHDLLVAERDENTCRKNPTPSEAAAIGMALEEIHRPAVAERQAEGRRAGGLARHGLLPENFTGSSGPPIRDIIGAAIGMSGPTYHRAKAVVEHGTPELIEAMDRGDIGIATAAVVATLPKDEQRKAVAQGKDAICAAARRANASGRTPKNKRKNGGASTRSPRRIGPGAEQRRMADFERAATTLIEVCLASADVAVPEVIPEERKGEIVEDLKRAVNAVRHFRRRIEEARV